MAFGCGRLHTTHFGTFRLGIFTAIDFLSTLPSQHTYIPKILPVIISTIAENPLITRNFNSPPTPHHMLSRLRFSTPARKPLLLDPAGRVSVPAWMKLHTWMAYHPW
ncbi:hypothetical protein XPA_003667 [Xanthoria parietina]